MANNGTNKIGKNSAETNSKPIMKVFILRLFSNDQNVLVNTALKNDENHQLRNRR